MTTAGWVALAITIFSAFSYAAASILQAIGARRSTSTVKTLKHPLYLAGTGFDLLSWVGSMIALGHLAVYLVESVLAGSLAVTVVAARLFLKSRLRKIDVLAVAVSVAALTVLAMSAGPQESVAATFGLRVSFCVAALSIALLGLAFGKYVPPGMVAALAGLCLGGAALVGRALTFPDGAMASFSTIAMAVLTEPLIGALLVFGVTGMLLYATALQRGQVGPVTAVLWIAEVVAPSAVAVMFLGDTVRAGWGLPALIAGAVTVLTAVVLASAPANKDAAAPQAALEAPPERLALAAAPAPAVARPAPTRAEQAERIVWWGPPPIWVPPPRPQHALPAASEPALAAASAPRELTWNPVPDHQPLWANPVRPDADTTEVPRPAAPAPAPARWPYPTEPIPTAAQLRPWDDL
jgi:hypothetical protein